MSGLSRLTIQVNTKKLQEGELAVKALGDALDALQKKAKKVQMPEKLPTYATRMMRNATRALAISIANNLYISTPQGDNERIKLGQSGIATEQQYFQLYRQRLMWHKIPMQAGYHAGAYKYSESPVPKFEPKIYTIDQITKQIKTDFMQNFQLGDVFYIGARGPAYEFMQGGVDSIQNADVAADAMQGVMLSYKAVMQAAIQQTRISHR